MQLSTPEVLLFVAVMAACTFLTRVLPFLLFPARRKTPRSIAYLGDVLPFAIIGMLVVYCLKGVTFLSRPYGIPEIIAITAIVLAHHKKHNLLLSIGGGTALYVGLLQLMG